MADKLFYTYSNSSQSKTEASAKSTDHPYSPIFDGGRKSIWANGTEYGYFGLGPSSGSGSIISALTINSNHELCASYISVTDLNNSLTADNFQSASFDSGLQISTHQENGTNCGTGHLFVPVATTSQYGVAKVGSGSGKVGISSGVLTYAAANNGKLYVRKDTDTGSSIMTANQSGNTYLSFSAGTGISIAQSSGTVTITNSSPNSHNSHALTVTNNTASAITSATTLTFVESVSGCSATSGDLTASTTRKKIVIGNGAGLVGINASGQLTYNASGGNAEGCVTYNSGDSPGVHEIRVVTTPGTAQNTLYIIL